ncbi:MAG: hypothetical protein ABI718_05035 [Acidobacteriota bacterium]
MNRRMTFVAAAAGASAISALLILCPSPVFAQAAPFSGAAPVTLTPSSSQIAGGANVIVDVNVDLTGITGTCGGTRPAAVLGGFAIPVAFDNKRLEFMSSDGCSSPEFTSSPTTTNRSLANSSGTVSVANSQTGQYAPTGKVCVARLTFRGVGDGTAAMIPDLSGVSLSSSFQYCNGGFGSAGPASIPATVVGTSVNVSSPGPPVASDEAVIPVVASTPGDRGSYFRTTVQMYNSSDEVIDGRIVYHSAGSSGSASDPSLPYSIRPGQAVTVADLLPAMGQKGLGSADIVAANGVLPVSVIRIFDDNAPDGTAGMTERVFLTSEALTAGDRAVLLAPHDPVGQRFNIGVRALREGATIRVSVKSKENVLLKSMTKTYPATWFLQQSSAEFLGMTLSANDEIIIDIVAGKALIYGAATDNMTNDPSMQIANRIPLSKASSN